MDPNWRNKVTRLNSAAVSFLVAMSAGLLAFPSLAKVPAEQASQLGGDKYTCTGAEKAGTADGVAAFSGKWLDSWPGMESKGGYSPGPYADEKPLFTITAQNMAQYADKLTDSQKGMFQHFPNAFRMNVYPSHRDFRVPDGVCKTAKSNALAAELTDNGLGSTALSRAIAFPFPQSGLEAVWNITQNNYGAMNEAVVYDSADVYANGSTSWARHVFRSIRLPFDLKAFGLPQEDWNTYAYDGLLAPPRDKDTLNIAALPSNFAKNHLQTWQYNPGTRRVRQLPNVGFDYPEPPAGVRTVDEDYLFNGSPERYDWKLLGKREIYVPYNNFRINDPSLKYKDILGPQTVNPEYQRYELHRVWVVEGLSKPGVRHIYQHRILYVDEDSWLALWSDIYDARAQLWRASWIDYHYSAECECYHRGTSIYQDLLSGTYEVAYLVNEAGTWWKLNDPRNTPDQYGPKAAEHGH